MRLSTFTTVLPKASLPVPKANVFGPLHITAKVEVVLFGLKSEGMLYRSGDGDFELPEKPLKIKVKNLPLDFCLNRSPTPNPAALVFFVVGRE